MYALFIHIISDTAKSEANNYTALLITFPLLTLVTTSQNSFSKKIRNTELKLDYTSILCNLFLMLKEKKKHAAFDVLHFGMHQVLYLYSIWTIHVFVHIWYVHAIKKNI